MAQGLKPSVSAGGGGMAGKLGSSLASPLDSKASVQARSGVGPGATLSSDYIVALVDSDSITAGDSNFYIHYATS